MKKRTVNLPDSVCPIAWIIENQDEVIGCGFNITQKMRSELLDEAKERGRVVQKIPFLKQRLFIPPDFSVPDDSEACIDLQMSLSGYKVKKVSCEDISNKGLFKRNHGKETIDFVRE